VVVVVVVVVVEGGLEGFDLVFCFLLATASMVDLPYWYRTAPSAHCLRSTFLRGALPCLVRRVTPANV